jgi:hypothetical protein
VLGLQYESPSAILFNVPYLFIYLLWNLTMFPQNHHSPASASSVSGIAGVYHHAWLNALISKQGNAIT